MPKIKILEYLGGIETIFYQSCLWQFYQILEYLGGIETFMNWYIARDTLKDFRIPRRDWNPEAHILASCKEDLILEYLGGIETYL